MSADLSDRDRRATVDVDSSTSTTFADRIAGNTPRTGAESGARLLSEDRVVALRVEGIREGADGRLVVRIVRKLENHPEYDRAEDAAIDRLLLAFVAWLESPDGDLTQVVRLSPPKGAELRDVGKWAIEYAPVAGSSTPAGR